MIENEAERVFTVRKEEILEDGGLENFEEEIPESSKKYEERIKRIDVENNILKEKIKTVHEE